MTVEGKETRWIDVETAGRRIGVTGYAIRKWCRKGRIAHWRRSGFGSRKRYQITEEALELLRAEFHEEHRNATDESDESDGTCP